MMSEVILEKAICENCGVDVRVGTLFCYNCGGRLAKAPPTVVETVAESNGTDAGLADANTKAALDDLAKRLTIDDLPVSDEMSLAATQRRKARQRKRTTNEYVWEPAGDSANRLLLLLAILIAAITAGIVFLTVFWK